MQPQREKQKTQIKNVRNLVYFFIITSITVVLIYCLNKELFPDQFIQSVFFDSTCQAPDMRSCWLIYKKNPQMTFYLHTLPNRFFQILGIGLLIGAIVFSVMNWRRNKTTLMSKKRGQIQTKTYESKNKSAKSVAHENKDKRLPNDDWSKRYAATCWILAASLILIPGIVAILKANTGHYCPNQLAIYGGTVNAKILNHESDSVEERRNIVDLVGNSHQKYINANNWQHKQYNTKTNFEYINLNKQQDNRQYNKQTSVENINLNNQQHNKKVIFENINSSNQQHNKKTNFNKHTNSLPKAHCFPAGHPSPAFALMAIIIAPISRRWRYSLCGCAIVAGFGLSVVQMARGEHFFSHMLGTIIIAVYVIYLIKQMMKIFKFS